MKQNEFPPDWDKECMPSVNASYEQQMEEEAASQNEFGMLIEVLAELGPAVCEWVLEALIDGQ